MLKNQNQYVLKQESLEDADGYKRGMKTGVEELDKQKKCQRCQRDFSPIDASNNGIDDWMNTEYCSIVCSEKQNDDDDQDPSSDEQLKTASKAQHWNEEKINSVRRNKKHKKFEKR